MEAEIWRSLQHIRVRKAVSGGGETGEKNFFGAIFGKKPDFPGDFQRPNLTMWDILGWKNFHRH
jgi:hypothetical protein